MCVSSSCFSVLINGEMVDYFEDKKEPWQGDPLSPFLFLKVMEYLSRLLARPSSIITLKDKVERCLRSSGLFINLAKSHVFVAGMTNNKKAWVEQVLGTTVTKLPVRYLGIPLNSKAISSQDSSCLIGRITSIIDSWSNRFLSRAGRMLLIQYVLQSIFYFWARMCILPRNVLHTVSNLCATFLWKRNGTCRGGFRMSWKEVCKEKSEGGLGIKDLSIMNEAMRLNKLWEMGNDADSVWKAWTKAYWTKGRD
ncbi:hypothetical protein QQ045_033163 [Rhodiola kirilowii]